MTTKIEVPGRPLGHTLNILDPRAHPPYIDNEVLTPIVNINEAGFLRVPDPDQQIVGNVEVRNDPEVDPTIERAVVAAGEVPALVPFGQVVYGIQNNFYIYAHDLLLTASDPDLLFNTTLKDATFEITCLIHEAKYTVPGSGRACIFSRVLRGAWDFVYYNSGSVWFNNTHLTIPLPPVVLPYGYHLNIGINRNVGGLPPGISLQGLSVVYHCVGIKSPCGATTPQLRYR